MGLALCGSVALGAGKLAAPFRWLEPEAIVSPEDFKRLARGEVVVKPLSARSGQLGVFAVTALNAQPDIFVAWIREISQLQRSKAITASGRFSEPPVLRDLDGLHLDARDVESIRACRPGHCDLKLTASEIEVLRRTADGGRDVQAAFRRVVLDRLLVYRSGGLEAVAVPADRNGETPPNQVFAALQAGAPYIPRSAPRLATWLGQPERAADLDVESFYYWSKEYYSSGKAMVALTQVGVTRAPGGGSAPEVAVAGKQLFATRYMNGMLTHITLAQDAVSGQRYMTYTNRAQLDVLTGFWGGVVRKIINSRLRGDAATVLGTLRSRIESGPPRANAE
jgi:hypothetical protein